MKSIRDVRRQNLNDLIDREFNGVQTRMAEKLGTQANLVNRWALGKKVIGDRVARKLKRPPINPVTGLISIARFLRKVFSLSAQATLASWRLTTGTLDERKPRPFNTGKTSPRIRRSPVTISRLLNNEVSVSISTTENVASAFGRHGYELLIHPHDPATINYDRSRYALLPETEKAKIESYIEFVINQNEKNKQ